MTLRYPSALLLAAAITTGCDVKVGEHGVSLDLVEGKASDEWTRNYTLASGGQLEIVNANGMIEVFPATGPQVEVRVKREVRGRTDEAAQQLLKQVTITDEVTPDRVKVETAEPEERGFRQGVNVAYRVSVPPGLNVAVSSRNGQLRLENVDGRFTIVSTNGPITGRGLSGSIDASTVNGGITLDLASVSADVRIVTVNGPIRLDVRPEVNATLDATVVNGGIALRDGFPLEATERDRLRVAGRINKGGPKIVVQTTNGGIFLGGGRGPGRRGEPEVIRQELRTP
jgi:hypothetical protein